MKIKISSIFPEPGYSFKVSYKVIKLILELLNSEKYEGKADYDLGIVIATGEKVKTLEVKGPDISKRYKTIDYAVWIPYNSVIESTNMLQSYIAYLFEGIENVFLKEEIKTDILPLLKKSVEEKVLNNKEYEYV